MQATVVDSQVLSQGESQKICDKLITDLVLSLQSYKTDDLRKKDLQEIVGKSRSATFSVNTRTVGISHLENRYNLFVYDAAGEQYHFRFGENGRFLSHERKIKGPGATNAMQPGAKLQENDAAKIADYVVQKLADAARTRFKNTVVRVISREP